MKHNRRRLGALVVGGLLLAGCARAVNTNLPDAAAAPARNTPLCQHVIAFRLEIDPLNGPNLLANPQQAVPLVTQARDGSQQLVNDFSDPLLKADMQTIATGYDKMHTEMASLHDDPQQEVLALTAFGQDKQVTLAATAVQNFVRTQCGLNLYQVPTKGAVTTNPTTTVVVGPTGATTTTTAAPGATTTTPAATTAPPTTA